MMLTTKSRYAVMAVIEIALTKGNGRIKLSEISDNQGIPLSFLEQIFLKLKYSNIVNSFKGPHGGYQLAIDAKNLSVEAIIDAVEENLKMTRCSDKKFCGAESSSKCMTHDLWDGLGVEIRKYLSKITIAEIICKNQTIKEVSHDILRS